MFATNFHFKEILEWFDDSSFEYLLLFLPSSDTKDRKIDDYIIRNQASIDKLTGSNIAYISYTNMDFPNEIQHVKKHQIPPNAIRTHVYISDEVCDYYSFGQYKLPALILISKQLEYKLFPITKETDLDTYFAPIGIITSFLQDYYRVERNKDRYKSLDNDKKWRVEECTRLKEGNHLLEDTILEFKRDNQLALRIDSNYCRLFNYLKAKKVKQNTFENVFKDNLDENDIINKLNLLGLDKELNVYALELISDLKKVRNFKKFQAQYGNVTQQIERLINLCAQEINSNTERIEKLTTEISDIEREQLIAPEMLKKYDEELNDIIAIWGKKLNSTLLVDNGTEILSNALNHYSSVLIDILSMANEKLNSNNANDKHKEEAGDDRLIRNKEKYDVFISYSRKDLEAVKGIKEEIERATNAHCWMDLQGIESGAPRFIRSIIDGINMCDVFLFMRSKQSQDSKYALRELHYAEEGGKKFVIVHIDNSPMSEDFKFLYDLADTIEWDNLPQREKLLHDISKWTGSSAMDIKEMETVPAYNRNVFQHSQCDSELENWNKNGDDYYWGRDGKTKNYVEAVKWYRMAAEQGHAEAQFNLGYCYDLGKGLVQDGAKGLKWYRKLAEQEFAIAQYKLGIRYSLGFTKRKTECIKWLHKAADQGLIVAQYFLATCYQHGEGVVQNHTESAKWYRKAAERGFAKAQYQLGVCYSTGLGVTEDRTEAVKWYKMAAGQKDVMAQIVFGNFFITGFDITKDETEAIKWYHQYADSQGNIAAQYSLGNSYEYGYGVMKNLNEAIRWYRMAAEQGHRDAKKALDRFKTMGYQ